MKWMPLFMVLGLLTLNSANAFDPCDDLTVAHTPRADVMHKPQTSSSYGLTKGSHANQQDPAIKPVLGPDRVSQDDLEKVIIPITIDMAARYGIDVPNGILLESNVGMIEIYKDGRIIYNGEDITGNIEEKCNHDSGSETTTEQSEETKDGDNPDTGRELP